MSLLAWCLLSAAWASSAAAASPVLAVFGHKVPDTDSVTAALVYAWELNARNISATAYRLGELNPETDFVLKHLGVTVPPLLADVSGKGPLSMHKREEDTVAVVDTNSPQELPEVAGCRDHSVLCGYGQKLCVPLDQGILNASIHSIVDHHKLCGLINAEPLEAKALSFLQRGQDGTRKPAQVDMRPLCSATSILYARAKYIGLSPPKEVAGLMLAGILSDSLEFRSPTTTELDKTHAAELGKLAGLDVHDFAEGMLEAKANVDHLSPSELIMMDTKIFTIGGKKLRVSVMETTKASGPLAKKGSAVFLLLLLCSVVKTRLVAAMKKLTVDEKLDDVLFFAAWQVIDILKEAATFISSSPTATKLVEKAWGVKVDAEGQVVLPNVLSRKKQIIPKLEAAAKEA
ncbi:ppaC [Symbiodinium natans]|uniref:inorganic diphosphatase n=1 Tax=Symbiodinium natans TaxID=878477 RepID=A0A812PDC2_9DINO|nr:ppaC [Symbiodinium natans]